MSASVLFDNVGKDARVHQKPFWHLKTDFLCVRLSGQRQKMQRCEPAVSARRSYALQSCSYWEALQFLTGVSASASSNSVPSLRAELLRSSGGMREMTAGLCAAAGFAANSEVAHTGSFAPEPAGVSSIVVGYQLSELRNALWNRYRRRSSRRLLAHEPPRPLRLRVHGREATAAV